MASSLPVLVFTVEGRFGHFRRGYANRSSLTYPYPPRTALAGLVGAILGLPKPRSAAILGPDEFRVAAKTNRPIQTTTCTITYRQTVPGNGRKANQPTLIPVELLVRPSYTVYASLADEDLMAQLVAAVREHRAAYTPCLGSAEYLADVQYVGEGDAVPENAGALSVATVVPKRHCGLDPDRIRTAPAFRFQEIEMPYAGHPSTGFTHRNYLCNLAPDPIPLQIFEPVYRVGDEIVTFL